MRDPFDKPCEPSFRILAISDLHGEHMVEARILISALRPDWIVLCGDILPDFKRISGQGSRLEAQREFWATYRSNFVHDFALTTLIRGNHEIEGFSDPLFRRLPSGLDGRVVRLEGIPAEHGAFGWSREWEDDELERELQDQLHLAPEPWIYLSHVPPFGCLDRGQNTQRLGHRPLTDHLNARGWPMALLLCGHVHEGFGCTDRGQTLIVNVAGGWAHLEWTPEGMKVLDMSNAWGCECLEPLLQK